MTNTLLNWVSIGVIKMNLKILLVSLVLLFSSIGKTAYSSECHKPIRRLPRRNIIIIIGGNHSEYNSYSWKAISNDNTISLRGQGRAYSLRKAWLRIICDVNRMADELNIDNGTEFTIEFNWKGKEITRTLIVNKDRPTMDEALRR